MHDYLAIMLLNLTAGLTLLALFVWVAPRREAQPQWGPPFAMVGFVSTATGLTMAITWPLPGSFNIAYGDASLLFGISFLGAAWAVSRGQGLLMPSLWAWFAGVGAIIIGLRIMSLGMGKAPVMAGIPYLLAGVGGVLLPLYSWMEQRRAEGTAGVPAGSEQESGGRAEADPALSAAATALGGLRPVRGGSQTAVVETGHSPLRYIVAVILLASAVLWAGTTMETYWGHLKSFSTYSPTAAAASAKTSTSTTTSTK